MDTGEEKCAVPVIALAMGDPAGVAPELTARVVSDPDVRSAARLVVIGERRVLEQGAGAAHVDLDLDVQSAGAPLPVGPGRPVLVDLGHLDPAIIRMGEAS